MEDLFNMLSSSARIDKSKRKKKKPVSKAPTNLFDSIVGGERTASDSPKSRDRTGKRDTSEEKQQQVHREQIAAFRRSMSIQIRNKHDPDVPDPISSFHEMTQPPWWKESHTTLFQGLQTVVLKNIEAGRWKEPTPIQMQSIPTLLHRRDLIGAAPTGSGKSGAFLLPTLFLASAPADSIHPSKRSGEIRALLLAPSLELAHQLHREVERLGMGKPGGLKALLLSKSNAPQLIAEGLGGKKGVDVLVATPLRLVASIEKGLKLDSVRIVVLDEADRLLDAADGKSDPARESDDDDSDDEQEREQSGSVKSKTFLSQIDEVLSAVPSTAVRALFSATVTSMVRELSESVLRNPVDLCIAKSGMTGAANTDIQQELTFVGKEQGKLLAIRQLVARGELHPPAIIFLESQDRAQALFGELLYDGIHVDVIHAGRSKSARENAVAKFRKGETWVLICTDLVARGVDFRAVNMVINYDLPSSGITYVHRIGRTGRAGRKGRAITLFTESDFENLRTIANVMKQSGCEVPEWMLNLKRSKKPSKKRRATIDTTPKFKQIKKRKRDAKRNQVAEG